ncbi:hypothetical protein [Cellulomonas alba]|uniref:Uncharacterized protein n=1 Tax=Cellulomonas alba TaxID=3053467 RepID=A0ABT7SGU0_9CELL|nr:hypothetical protein [Cellulomonas alba]MDM7855393.1 hypothetical protein [Cellulomonas alba]
MTTSVLAAGALWFAAIAVLVVVAGTVARRRARARREALDDAAPVDPEA